MPAPPSLVVLAAGASRRLGEPKALVELAGRTALERLLAAGRALGSGPEEPLPLVVVGAHHDAIRAHLAGGVVEPCFNPDWAAGRTGSVALAARRREGRDLCVAPIDCPLVAPATFEALARAWDSAGAPSRGWLAPGVTTSDGERPRFGHPVVVGRDLARDLVDFDPAEPLRSLRERAEPLLAVSVGDRAVLDDLDTPADLSRLRAQAADRPSDAPH